MLKIQNRPARIILRILLYTFGVLLLFFVGVSIYLETNKKQLLNKLRVNLSKQLRSEVRYRDADVTLWSNFPFIGLHLYDIHVEDSVYRQPFFQMKEMTGEVSLLQYFRKNIQIRNLSFNDGLVHILTDSTGYTNKYLMRYKKSGDTVSARKMELAGLTMKNVRVILENRQRNKYFDFQFDALNADISGDRVWKVELENNAVIRSMAFSTVKGSYLKNQRMQMNMDITIDRDQQVFWFDEEKFIINNHPYYLKGRFDLKGDGSFSLAVRNNSAPYAGLRNILSENIAAKLRAFNLEKPIDVNATIAGPLAYKTVPKVDVNWVVKNNVLNTEPAKFTATSFTGSFTNEKAEGAGLTDENSAIVLKDFTGNWDGITLSGKNITVTNLVQPQFNLALTSSTDLRTLNDKLGLKTIEFLKGRATLAFTYNGPLQKDLSILDRVNGHITISNGSLRYIPRGFVFNNTSGNILFSDNSVQVRSLQCDLGKNRFIVNATGHNLGGLSATDASNAAITCDVYSPSLNIADLTALFSRRQASARRAAAGKTKLVNTASRIDEALDHGSLSVSLRCGTVRYKNFTGNNLRSNIVFANNELQIKNASLQHANGSLQVSGGIRQDGNLNQATAKVNLGNVNVKELFRAFDDFGQDGIESDNIRGLLNATTNLNLAMNNQGVIVPGTMRGTVDFSLRNGALVNYEPLQDIKNAVLRKKDMSNVTFAELKNRLEINGYKIKINRMEIQSSAIGMFVEGIYDLKKTDSKIDIQVPLKGLKQRDSSYVPQNIGVNAKAGLSIYLEGKPDKKTGKVKFGLNTTRTLRKLI